MTAPNPHLPSLTAALRSGDLPLTLYLQHLMGWFAQREPTLQAFIPEAERKERLLHEAEYLQARWPIPAERPPLFGVPIGVKDIFHVAGLATGGGTRLPPDLFQGDEGPVVQALRQAGALVLGKTVTTEFAYFAPGPTRNPHHADHTPGGSSSGSAAAVAAGLTPLALGTQTVGSIIRPAAYCGVVGVKPSYDLLSRAGVLPLAPSTDHVGWFTTDVASSLAVAAVLLPGFQAETLTQPPVLGVPTGDYLQRATPEAQAHFEAVLVRLAAAGMVVRRLPAWTNFAALEATHTQLVAIEAAQVHAQWYAQHASLYHPKTAALIERGQHLSQAALAEAHASQLALRERLTQQMQAEGLTAWIAPAAPGPAPIGLESTGDPIMNLPWTHSGLPVVGLPSGVSANGLPLAIQLTGGWLGEAALLAAAEQVAAALA